MKCDFRKKYDLTKRETEVYLGIVNGLSLDELGKEMKLSYTTLKSHLNSISQKLGYFGRYRVNKMIADYWKSRNDT